MAGNKRPLVDNDGFEERKRERQAVVVAKVQDMSPDAAREYLETICRRWKLDDHRANITFQEAIDMAFQNFGLDLSGDVEVADQGNFGFRALDERIHEHEMELIALYHALKEHGHLEDAAVLSKVTACLEQVYYAKHMILSAFQAKLGVHELQSILTDDGRPAIKFDEEIDSRLGSWSLRFRWIDDNTNPQQKLLLHMLDRAMERKYRRQGDWCFEPVLIDGLDTHAWRAVVTIKEWMYRETRKETNWEQWHWMTSSASVPKMVVEYLANCVDHSFPELKKDRSTFAFLNGVYRAKENKFYPHAGSTLPKNIAACKFFGTEFPSDLVEGDPEAIPTPHFESIMEYQGWEPEVKRWMYILLGRLLYNLGELDSWQVIPFAKGQASSGKSTITLKVAKEFYDDIDVGCLSNNIETRFGLSQFHDKLLFVAPEIKSDLKIEQAEFQSIVSGEQITINIKNKTAISTEWHVPGVLAGNEVPSWCDNSGSIQRRIVLFDFPKQVTNGDMKLGEKLANEISFILLKCNRMYLEAVARWSHTNIWTILPAYFLQTRNEMAQATNVLEAFLISEDVVVRPGVFCAMDDFKAALKTFAQSNNYSVKRVTGEFFRGPFDKFQIKKTRDTRLHQGKKLLRDYLEGVDITTLQSENLLG